MSASTPLSGANQPLRGILLVVLATFLFAGPLGLLILSHTPDSTALVGIVVICLSGPGAAWMQRRG